MVHGVKLRKAQRQVQLKIYDIIQSEPLKFFFDVDNVYHQFIITGK